MVNKIKKKLIIFQNGFYCLNNKVSQVLSSIYGHIGVEVESFFFTLIFQGNMPLETEMIDVRPTN